MSQAVFGRKNSKSRRNGAPKWRLFGKMGVETLGFGFATPKRHFLARNRVVWRILFKNRCARLGCSVSQEPPPQKKSSRVTRGAKSRMRRTETPKPIWIKFCVVVDIPDVVTYTYFGDHRLSFLGGGGSNSPLSHWLSSSPLQHSRTTVRVCDAFFIIIITTTTIVTNFAH